MLAKPSLTRLSKLTTLTSWCVQAQADLQQGKEALKQEKALMQTLPVADNDIVNLNVGGTLLSTKRSTLTQVFTLDHA